MLSKTEMILNSRQLNMLHDDEMYEIMTPNHLLFGRDSHTDKIPIGKEIQILLS